MSFRNRLTSFFVLIVLLPMIGVAILIFSLISDSGSGKARSRANGVLTSAAAAYSYDALQAEDDVRSVALKAGQLPPRELRAKLKQLLVTGGLARITLALNGRTIIDVGSHTAIAPATARYTVGDTTVTVRVSTTTAGQLAQSESGSGTRLIVRQGDRVLAATVTGAGLARVPRNGTVTFDGVGYETATPKTGLAGFGPEPIAITALSDLRATASSLSDSRFLAAFVIFGFVMLAVSFAILASRGLESQLSRFLGAARRLAGGDFSAPVPIEGSDEFAMLAAEFNNMSSQLAHRLDELAAERSRLRESIRRAGETFASNLDRQALLALALKTAVDGVEGEFGRLSARSRPDSPLFEVVREQSLEGVTDAIQSAEQEALVARDLREAGDAEVQALAVPVGPVSRAGRAFGLLTVGRRGRPFNDDDKDLLRSLAAQTTLALENIELHQEVQRQAVTDELTGLNNHGRFQEVIGTEMEQVRRYHYPVGLIMLDLDNFKRVNDTYGHPQGDQVLRHVARVLQETSREADSAARYGGEEMALVLPHTDIEGSYAIAERVRVAIEALEVPMVDGSGHLKVTASLGVGVTLEGHKESLIATTDAALYRAKHGGKNRTERADPATANAGGGE